ncbi:MAG: ABC transporter substrate-binding protein [Cyanobacteria bacterium P01_D01_bin.156]
MVSNFDGIKSLATGLLVAVLATSCRQTPSATADLPETQGGNCVEEYDPTVDYFPTKLSLSYASGFVVEYSKNYKVVTVTQPWQDANETFEYVLVQCGTPEPEGFENAQLIQVPIDTVATLSTTYLPHLEVLEQLDALVGMDNFSLVYAPKIRAKIDDGKLIEFQAGQTLNIEALLVSDPDLVMTYGAGDPDTDSYGRMIQAGLPVAVVGDYVETSPLGRAEWLKFTALFFNQEAEAQQIFAEISDEYGALVALTDNLAEQPTVFAGFSYEGTWYMSGGKSYAAQLLRDAGGDYLWQNNNSTVTIPLDFESVVDQAADAEIWVNVSQDWQSYGDAIATDPRYGSFSAFKQDSIYNNHARMNAFGGNDYWESGAMNPHLILADLVKIFHPELLPDHELVYYQKLEP